MLSSWPEGPEDCFKCKIKRLFDAMHIITSTPYCVLCLTGSPEVGRSLIYLSKNQLAECVEGRQHFLLCAQLA